MFRIFASNSTQQPTVTACSTRHTSYPICARVPFHFANSGALFRSMSTWNAHYLPCTLPGGIQDKYAARAVSVARSSSTLRVFASTNMHSSWMERNSLLRFCLSSRVLACRTAGAVQLAMLALPPQDECPAKPTKGAYLHVSAVQYLAGAQQRAQPCHQLPGA
jgi:hypothetical protein